MNMVSQVQILDEAVYIPLFGGEGHASISSPHSYEDIVVLQKEASSLA